MDYHTFIDYWEEEIHGIVSSMQCNLLWTIISSALASEYSNTLGWHQHIVVSSSLMTCTSFKAMTMLHF